MGKATRLAHILQNEFLFIPSCGRLEDKISESLDKLVYMGFLNEDEVSSSFLFQ